MSNVIQHIRDFFVELLKSPPCRICQEKDYRIAELKEELKMSYSRLDEQQRRVDEIFERQLGIIEHYTGVEKARHIMRNDKDSDLDLKTIPRTNSIRSRINRAEAASKDEVLTAQRKREFEDRIEKLLNPEIQVLEDSSALSQGSN